MSSNNVEVVYYINPSWKKLVEIQRGSKEMCLSLVVFTDKKLNTLVDMSKVLCPHMCTYYFRTDSIKDAEIFAQKLKCYLEKL